MSTTKTGKRKVISRKNRPAGLPVWQTITAVLLLDRMGAAYWVWWAAVFALGVWWGFAIVCLLTEKPIDVFAWDTPKLNRERAATKPFVYNQTHTDEFGVEWDVTAGGHA